MSLECLEPNLRPLYTQQLLGSPHSKVSLVLGGGGGDGVLSWEGWFWLDVVQNCCLVCTVSCSIKFWFKQLSLMQALLSAIYSWNKATRDFQIWFIPLVSWHKAVSAEADGRFCSWGFATSPWPLAVRTNLSISSSEDNRGLFSPSDSGNVNITR